MTCRSIFFFFSLVVLMNLVCLRMFSSWVLLFLVAATVPPSVQANDKPLKKRAVKPVLNYTAESLETCSDCWVQIKFKEGWDVKIGDQANAGKSIFVETAKQDLTGINELIGDAVEMKRTFSGDRERFRQYKRIGELKTGIEAPDLGLWFDVRFPADRREVAEKLNACNKLDPIEIAIPVPAVSQATFSPGTIPSTTPDFTKQQGYLYDTPLGLNAPAAWALPGGRGDGVKFIDVELGWSRDHEDFDQSKFFFNGHAGAGNEVFNEYFFNHGTAVLGEVVGMDNDFGVVGFASDALWGTVAYSAFGAFPNVAEFFLEAAEALDPGDVWLIEIQMQPPGADFTPMEYLQVNFDAIWISSFVLDVICVEAGANGGQNLDGAFFEGRFDRNVRDSGAILVAAGRPDSLTSEDFSNYGSRVDAHAWGSSIVTTGYGTLQNSPGVNSDYASGFGGTSGASPMIVGACLCLQGIHKARSGGQIITPIEMRNLISSTGTPHQDTSREIGPRPDIAAAISALPVLLGDCDLNGVVNSQDISPFITVLITGIYLEQADCDLSGVVDFLDIRPFIQILLAQ